MITLRIRGLYAAALTALFRQHSQVWEVVQPDEEIQTALDYPWRMDAPDVTIDEQPDVRGNRDVLRIVGPAEAVEQAVELMQQQCLDIMVRRESSQLGATYMGLVGVVSYARRRAVVYLGERRAGLLALRHDDRDVQVGAYLPVRIEALSSEGDERPQLSAVVTVPGQYAVLTSSPSIKFSKQINDPSARERLHRLGEAQTTGGWGILWRTAAQEATEQVLVQEIAHLTHTARTLQERIAAATTLGYLSGGEMVAQVFMPGHAKSACDGLRAAILPTLPGHHKYKARGDVYGAIVDALEKELPAESLRARTASLNVLSSINALQLPIHDLVRCVIRHGEGQATEAWTGQRLAYDLEAGWVDIRQALTQAEDYPAALRLEPQPGDYAVTRFQEGQWWYTTRFYNAQGEWQSDYARITMPLAIFSDQLHVVDLPVTVLHSPQQAAEIRGFDVLQTMQQQGRISTACAAKIHAEAQALLQQWNTTANA